MEGLGGLPADRIAVIRTDDVAWAAPKRSDQSIYGDMVVPDAP